mmetsp:Transcript_124636/g.360582  ORF Transcript_124636/g.360582 Transcript_124636/m.360582 type:complete len:136 (-) Transcript_124636:96-503(-)
MQRMTACKNTRRQPCQRRPLGAQRSHGTGAASANTVRVVLYGEELALPKDVLFDHPGGPDVIYAMAGRDCTAEFEAAGHSSSALQWAEQYAIGPAKRPSDGTEQRDSLPAVLMLVSVASAALTAWQWRSMAASAR